MCVFCCITRQPWNGSMIYDKLLAGWFELRIISSDAGRKGLQIASINRHLKREM